MTPEIPGETVLDHPVVLEARRLADELRLASRAVRADWTRYLDAAAPAAGSEGDPTGIREVLAAVERGETVALPETAPVSVRRGLDDCASIGRALDRLLDDPRNRALVDAASAERARTLREAVSVLRRETDARDRARTAEAILEDAARSRRPLTPSEQRRLAVLDRRAPSAQPPARPSAQREAVIEAVGVARVREARRQLRDGLLITEQMRRLIRSARPALHRGAPILLIGETGGAKTALAEHLSRRVLGAEPELVSGYGDISSAQVIGSHELRGEGGATVTAFESGPLLRAMRDGRPLILDEINAMPPEFLKRLNRILQLRPGAVFPVQEQAGLSVPIAEGFAIIATANEQAPHRYRGIETLSAELVNRFGADTYRIRYPDAENDYTGFPRENALLAAAAVAEPSGELPEGITSEQIERVARAAFISQQVFSGNHGEGFEDFLSTEQRLDEQPGLAETVIAPRTLVAILEKAAANVGLTTLEETLQQFADGVVHREDRRVLELILEGQGLRP